MKKNLLFAAFIAMSLMSCSKDNGTTPVIKPKAVETASATIELKTPDSKTSKIVNRGLLYAWISEIDINTKSNDFAYAPFVTPFVMTDLPAGTVTPNGIVDGSYKIDNVALGSNDFNVTTKCSTTPSLTFESTTADPIARMILLKSKNPFALYSANILGAIVSHGANVLPPTVLTTNNGRACAVFTLNPAMTALGVTAKVSHSIIQPQNAQITCNGTTNASFYWSNEQSIAGATVTFTVDLYDNNGHKFNTFTTAINIAASTSVNNIYVINESDITTNTEMDIFTAQLWVDQNGGGIIGN